MKKKRHVTFRLSFLRLTPAKHKSGRYSFGTRCEKCLCSAKDGIPYLRFEHLCDKVSPLRVRGARTWQMQREQVAESAKLGVSKLGMRTFLSLKAASLRDCAKMLCI